MERGGSRGFPCGSCREGKGWEGKGKGSLLFPTPKMDPLSLQTPRGAWEGVWERVCALAEAEIPIFHLRIVPSRHGRSGAAPALPGAGDPAGAGAQRVPRGLGNLAEPGERGMKSLAAEREAAKTGILRLSLRPYTENEAADS